MMVKISRVPKQFRNGLLKYFLSLVSSDLIIFHNEKKTYVNFTQAQYTKVSLSEKAAEEKWRWDVYKEMTLLTGIPL